MTRTTAAIIVDVQTEFCEGGPLAVAGGTEVARSISRWLATRTFDHVVATRDHQLDAGPPVSAASTDIDPWPTTRARPSADVALHPDLDTSRIEAVFDKGRLSPAYSGFEGFSNGVPLAQWLREHSVDSVVVVGIATDHCVLATALDAVEGGFATTVELGLTAGVAQASVDAAVARMRTAGVNLVGQPTVAV